jgi:hypothetical protein
VREPGVQQPEDYRRRVYLLAGVYFALFATSVVGLALLLWQAKLFVTLAQRSNVETLTLAFFLVFFLYVALLSRRGMIGSLIVAYYYLAGLFGDREEVEKRKHERIATSEEERSVALNLVLEREGHPNQAFDVQVEDRTGSLGTLRVDGARVSHEGKHHGGSNNIFAYFAHQVLNVLDARGVRSDLEVVHWMTIDDEAMVQYLAGVQFARNLQRHLGAEELWPRLVLNGEDLHDIEQRMSQVCSALRNEAFLPDWEYSAAHKLPIIPEPLGLLSLSRAERRADPLATMGMALAVVTLAVVALALLTIFPPWVPST